MAYKIYRIKNLINQKSYVGLTKKSIISRFKEHCYYSRTKRRNRKIHNALRKYGEESFRIELISECENYQQALNQESFFIKKFNSFLNGYNCNLGGYGLSFHTKETKRKMSESHSGEKNAFYGKRHSTKTKEMLSKLLSGPNNPNFGKVKTQSEKENIGEKNSKNYFITFPDGKIKHIRNLTKFCRENKLDRSSFYDVLNGTRDKYREFKIERD